MVWKRIIWGAILGTAALAAPSHAQTDEEVWPTGVNGPKVWPPELSNPWSNAGTNYVYPEGGNPPPINLMTERIKCKDNGIKVRPKTYNSAPWETSRHHPPGYAFDEFSVSRWSSNNSNERWLAGDLGSTMTINQVYLIWEVAYAKDYDIQFSADSVTWTTAKQVRGGNGQADVVDLTGTGRYIRMWAVAAGSPYGYSLYEFTICREGTTATREAQARAAEARTRKGWTLVMDARGLPQGLRAVDAAGRLRSARNAR
jgi:hypothetical protein